MDKHVRTIVFLEIMWQDCPSGSKATSSRRNVDAVYASCSPTSTKGGVAGSSTHALECSLPFSLYIACVWVRVQQSHLQVLVTSCLHDSASFVCLESNRCAVPTPMAESAKSWAHQGPLDQRRRPESKCLLPWCVSHHEQYSHKLFLEYFPAGSSR